MSRKDFILLAEYIAGIKDEEQRRTAAMAVSAACKVSSSTFDTGKFLRACKVD